MLLASSVEAKDAAKHPAMHRPVPRQRMIQPEIPDVLRLSALPRGTAGL